MDLKEPIPEQAAEPAEANEAVPVAEEVAGEAVPDEEAPETAAEAAVPEEEAASEPPEVDEPEVGQPDSEQAEVELVTAVAAPTAVPSIGAAPEAASAAAPASASETAPPAPPHKPFIKLESRDNEADLSPFSVIVSQVYDGPLDLLLDLIRKQDIDVYDIPIARITAQFLAYVNQLKATDVDVAGEFIYTASLLIHIKSKMLLPRAPSGQDDAAEDPRRELVERLLEHERFKNAAQMLQQKQMLEAATWTNPGLREFQDDTSAEPEIAADTVDLVRIFRDILERARNRPVIDVEEDSVTVGQMIQFLARRLTMEDKPVALRRLLSHTRSERALIAMFLALLELVRLQAILLRQDLAFSEIFIKKHTGFEAVMNEGAASARDDWR
jgi:segregation and condensation protein A